jgi:hypothetical protein
MCHKNNIGTYLITTSELDCDQSFEIIKNRPYNKCNNVDTETPIIWIINLNWSISENWRPIGLDKPKIQEQELWQWILCKGCHGLLS